MDFHLVTFLCILGFSSGYGYKISLTSNSPVVVGATISFTATVRDDYNQKPSGTYQFKWRDNAMPPHTHTFEGEATTSVWNVTYPREQYSPGLYEVQVEISRWTLFFWNVGSKRLYFELTALLNGGMNMTQNNQTVTGDFVSSVGEVTHHIQFSGPDATYLQRNATSIVAYWFVDCIYYGATDDLSFKFNYSDAADQDRSVEALVVASFEPIIPPTTTTVAPPTTTTTLAPTTVTPSPNTTTSTAAPPTTSTIATTTSSTVKPSNNVTGKVQPNLKLGTNVSEIPILPYVCLNTSIVPPDPKKTYGYFSSKVEVKAPVSNVKFSPKTWLQHGEILNLSVTCNGSGTFSYCFISVRGDYNVTGNESCPNLNYTPDCELRYRRYYQDGDTYTVLIIIQNQVSTKITPVTINIYKVKKHPQLSVIVVPVVSSAIAVILIVFGLAYYWQSRNRYSVEVADFDFAQTSDLEYMTFNQRLRLAFNNALQRTHEYVDDSSVWSPTRKYGSMQ